MQERQFRARFLHRFHLSSSVILLLSGQSDIPVLQRSTVTLPVKNKY